MEREKRIERDDEAALGIRAFESFFSCDWGQFDAQMLLIQLTVCGIKIIPMERFESVTLSMISLSTLFQRHGSFESQPKSFQS